MDRGLRSVFAFAARRIGAFAGDFDWKDARKVLSRTLAGKRKAAVRIETAQVWAELVQRMWAQRTPATSRIDMSSWQLHIPVEVELYTTRAGGGRSGVPA